MNSERGVRADRSRHRREDDGSVRNVAASGPVALAWLAARGWVVEPSVDALQLASDELARGSFVLSRTWVTRTILTRTEDANLSDLVEVTLIVEGSGQASVDGHVVEFARGTVLLRPSASSVTLVMLQPTALVELRTKRTHLSAPLSGPVAHVSTDLDSGIPAVFLATAMATLNAVVSAETVEYSLLERGIEVFLDGLISSTEFESPYPPGSSARRKHYQQATSLIRARATASDFTLESVATELAISRSYLQRIFREAGSTPLRYLHEIRAAEARRLITELGPTSRAEQQEIAQRSGFKSRRTMYDVLARIAPRD